MPEVLGVFAIQQPLAATGPYGVFQATDPAGNPVRLSTLNLPPDLGEGEKVRIVSTLERTLAARVESPPVSGSPRLLGGGEQDGVLFIAESWPETPSVREQVASAGPMSAETVVGILQGVAQALEPVHQAGQAHPWLSPDNVSANGASATVAGQLWTALIPMVRAAVPGFEWPATVYVAPEVRSGSVGDNRSESWSAAALAVFALTGKDPEPGNLPEFDAPAPLRDSLFRSLREDPSVRCSCVKAIVVEVAVEQAITMQDAAETEVVPTGGDVPDWAAALLKETSHRRASGKPLVDSVPAAAPTPAPVSAAPPPPTSTPRVPPFTPPAPRTPEKVTVIRNTPRPAAPELPRFEPSAAGSGSRFDWREGIQRKRFPVGLALTAAAVVTLVVIGVALTLMH